MGERQPTAKKVDASVLAYFLRNPAAADSVEGISRWRLLDQRVHELVIETREALERLVASGKLERVERPGMDALYRLPQRRAKARRRTAARRRES
jgi:hypothetical protein